VDKHGHIFVTLNPPYEVDPKMVFKRIQYEHPVIDGAAVTLQRQMPSVQNTRGISYAGAWMSYGFHEDGFTSGLRAVVDHIPDVTPPFEIEYPDREPSKAMVGYVFDVLQATGCATVLGTVFSVALRCVACLFSPFISSSKRAKQD